MPGGRPVGAPPALCIDWERAATVMVRLLLLKVAIRGAVPLMVNSAVPLVSA